MTLIALEDIHVGYKLVKQVLLKKDTVPIFPLQDDLLLVCMILDVKVSPPVDTTGMKRLLDIGTILHKFRDLKPTSIPKLKEIVQKHFKWSFFEFPNDITLHEHMWRV